MTTLSVKQFFTRLITLELSTILGFYAMDSVGYFGIFVIGSLVFGIMFIMTFYTDEKKKYNLPFHL